MAAMNDSTKRKEQIEKKSSRPIVGAVGVVQTPGELEQEIAETTQFWQDAVTQLRGESFQSIEEAVERVVELASQKVGSIADGESTKAFMREALLGSEEVLETLKETLSIK